MTERGFTQSLMWNKKKKERIKEKIGCAVARTGTKKERGRRERVRMKKGEAEIRVV